MNWKRVDEHIESAGYVPETIADKLKRTQEELGRHNKMAMARMVKVSVLSLVFGMALGAFTMVYFETPKPQPVAVMAPTAVTVDQLAGIERRMAALEASKEANTVRAEQRVMDMRTALDKLERLKAKQDGQLVRVEKGLERSSGDYPASKPVTQDASPLSIQQMAKDLGVTSAVVK